MKVNINEFKRLLKKATINFSIDSVRLNITPENIKSNMIKQYSKDAISVLNVENNIFSDLKDEFEFNFSEPASKLIPYINLIDDEVANLQVKDEYMILKSGSQKAKIHFAESDIPSVSNVDKPKFEDPFISIDVDEDFLNPLAKIKKVANKFGKIYFGVEDKQFFIETTDRDNKNENNLRFYLEEIDLHDLVICLDHTNIVNVFNVLDNESAYKIYFTYLEDKDMGMMHIKNEEENIIEDYYLMSKVT